MLGYVRTLRERIRSELAEAVAHVDDHIHEQRQRLVYARNLMVELDPTRVLERGYALLRGDLKQGSVIDIETARAIMKARIEHYEQK